MESCTLLTSKGINKNLLQLYAHNNYQIYGKTIYYTR